MNKQNKKCFYPSHYLNHYDSKVVNFRLKLLFVGMLQDDEVEDVEVGIPGQAVLT